MNERAVRSAAARIELQAHGLFMGTGEPCHLVPISALVALIEAVAADPEPALKTGAVTAEPPVAPEPAARPRAGGGLGGQLAESMSWPGHDARVSC